MKMLYAKHLAQCLARREHSVHGSSCCRGPSCFKRSARFECVDSDSDCVYVDSLKCNVGFVLSPQLAVARLFRYARHGPDCACMTSCGPHIRAYCGYSGVIVTSILTFVNPSCSKVGRCQIHDFMR